MKRLDVLICEDIESDAALIIRKLTADGFEVHASVVETPEQMAGALQQGKWDVIISDFNIPGFGAEEALKLLHDSGKDIPFILVSGTVGEETAVSMMRAGAGDYLMKDSLARLGSAVRREIEEANTRRAHKLGLENLRANEARYRAVIDQSLFAIFLAQPDGLIQESNEAATLMFGYTAAEFRLMSKQQLLDFSDPSLQEKITERQKTGRSSGEFTAIRKNGERFYCEISSVVFKDINGEDMICSMLSDISERKLAAQQLKASNKQLKELSRHLKNAREDERKYIAKEVHDQLGQLATALKIDVDWLTLRMVGGNEMTKIRMSRASNTIDVLLTSIRQMATSLRPSVLDDFGLNSAIDWQCREFGNLNHIETVFTSEFDDRNISIEQKTEMYRMVQESLTNVMRHAQAGKVEVWLAEDDDFIHLNIKDDGRGFDVQQQKNTLGLIGLRERAESIGGELEITSSPGNGTCVKITICKK